MPLATTRDKHTEVIWGIKDFTYRFARPPEGMWLPETAVDSETLQVLAEHGILYTILAPHQANRVRNLNSTTWTDVRGGKIDTSMPYLCRLPNGKTISLFFYDAGIAYEIAFGNLLENGDRFAKRITGTFSQSDNRPHLISVATDGETYGHHHRFADMALAYALHTIESASPAQITVYGEYLSMHPPEYEVEIVENSSWSCTHGVERWRSDCGCHTDHACLITDSESCHPMDFQIGQKLHDTTNWTQKWRVALREAMDWLVQQLKEIYETQSDGVFQSPWLARDEYIEVIQNRKISSIDQFLLRHAVTGEKHIDQVKALQLLEMQRNALLMNTSCGWFFDELSGIETVQVMRYACRAIQLAKEICEIDLEPFYTLILQKAESNIPNSGNGADIYKTYAKTAEVSVSRAAFHYAIMSLFESYPEETQVTTYTIKCNAYKRAEEGNVKVVIGNACFQSDITLRESKLSFAAIYIGNHNFLGGIRTYTTEEEFIAMQNAIWDAFTKSDVLGMILSLNTHFESHSYSLGHLFRDGKRKVIGLILDSTLRDIETEYREIYTRYFSLMKAMKEMDIKPPDVLEYSIQYILNLDIQKNMESDEIDLSLLKLSIEAVINGRYKTENEMLQYVTSNCIMRQMHRILEHPDDTFRIETVNQLFNLINPLSLELNLWDCQNHYYRIGTEKQKEMHTRADTGDENAQKWLTQFSILGTYLGVQIS